MTRQCSNGRETVHRATRRKQDGNGHMIQYIRGGFSTYIDIGRLERESRRLLAAGFLVAVLLIMAAGLFLAFRTIPTQTATRPKPVRIMRMDIIEIPRQSREPLRVTEHDFEPKPLARPGFSFSIPGNVPAGSPLPMPEIRPPDFKVDIEGEIGRISDRLSDGVPLDADVPRAPDARIPLPLDAGNDPGMFRSDIIYRPSDKLAAQGYAHIPLIRSGGFTQVETYIKSLRGLAEGINRHTNVRAVIDNPYEEIQWHYSQRGVPVIAEAPSERGIPLNSLLTYHPPLVYILADSKIAFSPEEEEVIYLYLNSGGVMLIENARPGDPVLREHLRTLAGKLWYTVTNDDNHVKIPQPLDPIPAGHPLYHVFYDFSHGAPSGADQNLGAVTHRVQPYLEAVSKNGKLIVIYSDKGYGLSWAAEEYGSDAMKMGVNLMIFALVQRGEKPGHRKLVWE